MAVTGRQEYVCVCVCLCVCVCHYSNKRPTLSAFTVLSSFTLHCKINRISHFIAQCLKIRRVSDTMNATVKCNATKGKNKNRIRAAATHTLCHVCQTVNETDA